MTRDELVKAIREYAESEHSGWDSVSVLCRGQRQEVMEYLLVEASRSTTLSSREVAQALPSA